MEYGIGSIGCTFSENRELFFFATAGRKHPDRDAEN
jgi:hypothetical protein